MPDEDKLAWILPEPFGVNYRITRLALKHIGKTPTEAAGSEVNEKIETQRQLAGALRRRMKEAD